MSADLVSANLEKILKKSIDGALSKCIRAVFPLLGQSELSLQNNHAVWSAASLSSWMTGKPVIKTNGGGASLQERTRKKFGSVFLKCSATLFFPLKEENLSRWFQAHWPNKWISYRLLLTARGTKCKWFKVFATFSQCLSTVDFYSPEQLLSTIPLSVSRDLPVAALTKAI